MCYHHHHHHHHHFIRSKSSTVCHSSEQFSKTMSNQAHISAYGIGEPIGIEAMVNTVKLDTIK